MKRLALALAAVLATGCYTSSSYAPPAVGDVNLYWDFVRNAPAQPGGAVTYDSSLKGTPDGPCHQSAVDTVTVDIPGMPQVSVPCIYGGVQGVTIPGLPSGMNSFRVRGWRGAYAVYDGTFTFNVPVAGTGSLYADVAGVPAAMDLFAALWSGATQYATCASASYPTIDFQVWDSFGTLVDSAVAVPCTEPAYPSFPVFMGNLDLDSYTVQMEGYTGTPAARTFDSCTSPTVTQMAFDHFGAQTGAGGVAISLFTPPAC